MKVRFISDLHFGHENLATNLRGFSSAIEHDEYIIDQWNSIVSNKKDITYILGDITMANSRFYYLLNRLKGIKHVILGNHDRRQDIPKLLEYVDTVSGMINYKKEFILTHCPIHPSELEFRYKYNIHGHVHANTIPDNRYINVCCEALEYKPKTIEELF